MNSNFLLYYSDFMIKNNLLSIRINGIMKSVTEDEEGNSIYHCYDFQKGQKLDLNQKDIDNTYTDWIQHTEIDNY